ncbi:MAG: 4-diphosphocytidyl-2-C-methyl-D-erythritol kinase [Thermosediminibacterales bacterium]|nr:4-diphosphocytidyl-2-C-methyl-D-erythritol kinase [Thermosediminibacterales bacterium]MDK2836677.1 4-diphosphocytidyl-2-C-methyl-D-erythritol kinase [Thermosediminibacterales bacterium]
MAFIKVKARAKINLSLDVLDRRNDGYHDIETVMQSLELHDTIVLKEKGKGIELRCSDPEIPTDESNLAFKAAKSIMDLFEIKQGISIEIQKNIPAAAGLGGGSADAAAVLTGLNQLWRLGLNREELSGIGKNIGADVPFCLHGGTALCRGIGEKITELPPLPKLNLILLKPFINISTAWAYNKYDEISHILTRPNTAAIIKALEKKDVMTLAQNLCNVLEQVVINKFPFVEDLKALLKSVGALGSLMSGSGSCVYGIFNDESTAVRAYKILKRNFDGKTILTRTYAYI